MDCIKIIHIGDVHYPENFNKPLVDQKDKGIDSEFISEIAPNMFQKVSNEIIRVLDREDISAILLSGDLTSCGELEGYEKCVTYFVNIFNSYLAQTPPIHLHVVPGNHDLDRKLANSSTNKFDKFSEFVEIWKRKGNDILEPENVRKTSIKNKGSKLQLLSLNTCIGCGITRYFPEKIREKIQEIVDEENATISDNFELFGEKLDTPAATQKHISEIEESIRNCSSESSIPVILGHHGLLPQSIVRTEIYTEMINSGHMRSLFNSLDYPVIYCHGHIHDDPVETITQPVYSGSNLVTISAPEYCNGFNVIEFYFSSKKKPIGCIVRPFRSKTFGGVRSDDTIRIRLQNNLNIDDYCHEDVEILYKLIPNEDIYFREFIKESVVSDLSLNEDEISNILIELDWLGFITIDNRDKNNKNWIVKRIGL